MSTVHVEALQSMMRSVWRLAFLLMAWILMSARCLICVAMASASTRWDHIDAFVTRGTSQITLEPVVLMLMNARPHRHRASSHVKTLRGHTAAPVPEDIHSILMVSPAGTLTSVPQDSTRVKMNVSTPKVHTSVPVPKDSTKLVNSVLISMSAWSRLVYVGPWEPV